MEYHIIEASQIDALWELQKRYKTEIGEDDPCAADKASLAKAMTENKIAFYGVWEENNLIGCCSVTTGFSTFNYRPSGIFEDFYILPGYRHQGIARQLVQFAYRESGVSSLTVGCADCDVQMYQALGFTIPLGNLLALDF
ncbi:MAG: GNAT family N-acetyltransferase [Firmicutes bacterium]|nr:GNAT family N-acetyltransferase [Bacillota bacterium]